ncbi:MAG: hypothetical protein U1F77_19240 [Kiritimatiellia bacterium]
MELLAVVVFIVILLALVMVLLPAMRERARQVDCTAHLRQIHGLMMTFAADHDGFFHASPNGGRWRDDAGAPLRPEHSLAYWGVAYGGVAESQQALFNCPSMTNDVDDWRVGEDYVEPFRYASYGLNRYVNARALAQWENPSTLILAQDATEQTMDGFGSMDADGVIRYGATNDTLFQVPGHRWNLQEWRAGGQWFAYVPEAERGWFRHRNECNTAWLDGHASAIPETTGPGVEAQWYIGRERAVTAIWR